MAKLTFCKLPRINQTITNWSRPDYGWVVWYFVLPPLVLWPLQGNPNLLYYWAGAFFAVYYAVWQYISYRHPNKEFDGLTDASIKSPEKKGHIAERHFAQLLAKVSSNQTYLMHNVQIPWARSESGYRQVDLLWLTPKGIWVIECKNLFGHLEMHMRQPWVMKTKNKTWQTRNAFQQIWSQVEATRQFFAGHDIRVNVNGCLSLTHPALVYDLPTEKNHYPIVRTAFEIIQLEAKKSETTPCDPKALCKLLSSQTKKLDIE